MCFNAQIRYKIWYDDNFKFLHIHVLEVKEDEVTQLLNRKGRVKVYILPGVEGSLSTSNKSDQDKYGNPDRAITTSSYFNGSFKIEFASREQAASKTMVFTYSPDYSYSCSDSKVIGELQIPLEILNHKKESNYGYGRGQYFSVKEEWGRFHEPSSVKGIPILLNGTSSPKVSTPGSSRDTIKIPECPVCFVKFTKNGQIYQCHNGHFTCGTCYFNMAFMMCPECRGPIMGRAIGFERLLTN